MVELETDRLRLRAWRDEDVEALHHLNTDERVYATLSGRASTRTETQASIDRYRRHWRTHGFGIWAVDELASGGFVGRAGLAYHRVWEHDPEVGWTLDPGVWGRGYATEAGAASLSHAFDTLGFERVVSISLPDNVRSLRVMGRLGLRPIAEAFDERFGFALVVHGIERAEWARLQSSE